MAKKSYSIIIWDWKEQVDIDELNAAIKRGHIYFHEGNYDGDSYVLIASAEKLTKKQIAEIERKEFADEED